MSIKYLSVKANVAPKMDELTWSHLQQTLDPHALLATVLAVMMDEDGDIELTDGQLREFLTKRNVATMASDFGIATDTKGNGITISQITE